MTDQQTAVTPAAALPDWVPQAVQNYLVHTETGQTIRAVARAGQVHASTVLRQVRRFEGRRDDPLVDDALRTLATQFRATGQLSPESWPSQDLLAREGLRILRRLAEPGAILAVARDMETGVVVRDGPDGVPVRIAVVDRQVAQALALCDWIVSDDLQSRVVRYRLTASGRQELRRLLGVAGFADAATPFAGAEDVVDDRIRHMRSQLGESPLVALSRRRGKDGQGFLQREMVAAGERLREDFELSQAGLRRPQDSDAWLAQIPTITDPGANAARERVAAALTDLGPGLGDVVLRCCCYLEGLEAMERRLNWSARSGKIVLRIALQRLMRHYADKGRYAPMIG
jgi:DNA-binding PadR family transcriptional regulator